MIQQEPRKWFHLKQYFIFHDVRRSFLLLLPYIIRHWRAYTGLLFIVLIDIFLTLALAWFLGSITDAAVQRHFQQMKWLVPLGGLLMLLNMAISYYNNYFAFVAADRVKKDLEEHLLKHILLLPAKTVGNLRSGELLTHFTQDIRSIDGMIGSSLIHFIRLPLVFLAVFIYMFHIHWFLSLLSLLAVPAAVLSGAVFGILLRRNSKSILNLSGNMNGLLNEIFLGMSVIRSFTLEKLMFNKYAGQNRELYNLELRDTRLRGWFHSAGGAAGSAAFLMSLCLGAYYVSDEIISIGSLLSFVNLTNHLIYPLTGLAGLWAGFQRSLSAAERLSNVLEQPIESAELPSYMPSRHTLKSIEFRNITFSYDGQNNVFERFHLQIPAGKAVAIVGSSGAGKTTLFNLLQGFYKPQSGQIFVDKASLDDLSSAELRSAIAHVPQETFLFAGTIRDNLLLSRPGVTEAEMIQAAIDANIHEFILSLPQGYDTEIGERGVKLSGGQKQRIAIARAILKDAPILLLDEATSSLDSETEYHVKEALDRLMLGRTTLVIAHRLSTIHNADLIIVLDKGEIVQMGRHEELVSRRGVYRDLNHRQYFERRSVHH